MVATQRRPWYRIQWFADEDTKEERKLITKLDLMIVPYAFLAYWAKYIDQANISESGQLYQHPEDYPAHNDNHARQRICLRYER